MEAITPNSVYINKFFDTVGKFNNFLGMDEETIKRLNQLLEEIKTNGEIKKRYQPFERAYGFYVATIKYLLELEDEGIISVDERMYLFINIVDKDLRVFEVFSNNPMHDNDDIKIVEDKELQRRMYRVNYESNRKREKVLDDILGIKDDRIFEYEEIYHKNVIYRKKIIKEVNKDYVPEIVRLADRYENIYDVGTVRFDELKGIAQYLRKEIKDTNLSVLAHAILYQNDLLGLENALEQLIVFLLAADPSFHLIDIYEEESKYQQIKMRAIDELGFYAKRLVALEKKIIKKYLPNEKEANWMLLKVNE